MAVMISLCSNIILSIVLFIFFIDKAIQRGGYDKMPQFAGHC